MITTHSEQPENAAPKFESGVSKAPQAVSENQTIAALLSEISSLLASQGASEFRVHAYRNASRMLAELETPVRDVLQEEGLAGLVALPTIGRSIATLIEQYVHSGRIPLLHHLRGEDTAERVFATLPMLGPELSRRIHEHLEIETLPELLRAVQDGRLEQVPGIGRNALQSLVSVWPSGYGDHRWGVLTRRLLRDQISRFPCPSCWISMRSTDDLPRRASYLRLHRASSIRDRSHGYRSCIHIAESVTTPLCTPIPRGRTS